MSGSLIKWHNKYDAFTLEMAPVWGEDMTQHVWGHQEGKELLLGHCNVFPYSTADCWWAYDWITTKQDNLLLSSEVQFILLLKWRTVQEDVIIIAWFTTGSKHTWHSSGLKSCGLFLWLKGMLFNAAPLYQLRPWSSLSMQKTPSPSSVPWPHTTSLPLAGS